MNSCGLNKGMSLNFNKKYTNVQLRAFNFLRFLSRSSSLHGLISLILVTGFMRKEFALKSGFVEVSDSFITGCALSGIACLLVADVLLLF